MLLKFFKIMFMLCQYTVLSEDAAFKLLTVFGKMARKFL